MKFIIRIIALTVLIMAAITFIQNQSASATEHTTGYIQDVKGTAGSGFILFRVSGNGTEYVDAWYPAWLQKDRCRSNHTKRADKRACVAAVRAEMDWVRVVRTSINMARISDPSWQYKIIVD